MKSKTLVKKTKNIVELEAHSLNQLNDQDINKETENNKINKKKEKLNKVWSKLTVKLKSNWLLKVEFLFILFLVGIVFFKWSWQWNI